jgi:hypothetical protein
LTDDAEGEGSIEDVLEDIHRHRLADPLECLDHGDLRRVQKAEERRPGRAG